MEIVRTLLALALFGAAVWNLRLAAAHIRNMVGHNQRVNVSIDAIERGEVPPYPAVLADHLRRVADKGPAATKEKVRWDWFGMAALGIGVAGALALFGAWVWP